MRQEVLSHTCRDILAGVPFFASADPGFTNDIAAKLKAEFYQPKDGRWHKSRAGRS
ncbi:hypothetical protein IscW_ISCW006435 [Ixodes scapularis]|uniref:Uncharacterized protein n=1 Tax=Ixodes scapularis TaxID=6945 RepID=B7PN48_IXOSC|nr:hypothetical protein IscW_ISCW006435 [Ixodes scapularis]|eukprot:XP_002435196.1 hypothetical protein IscW_ISCW006435 [Ixodes scapularis]